MSENNDFLIDLTDSSFALADHCRLNNVIINLDTDDSFNVEENNQSNSANVRRSVPKRRKKTRVTVDTKTPVHDLCTPEIKNKKRSRQSKKVSENTSIAQEPTGEPEAKKAKQLNICCPICFEEFNGQTLASTSCGHVFCLQCLKLALKKTSRCPTCRTTLKGSSKFHPIFL